MKRVGLVAYIALIVLLAATAALAIRLYLVERQAHDVVNITKLPYKIGDWFGHDLEVTEKEYKILETRNIVFREYKNPSGEKLYLFIVYSETNRLVFHPPEICMIGSGLDILNNKVETVGSAGRSFTVNRMSVEKDGGRELVLYCYKVASLHTANFYKQQALFAVRQIFGRRVPGATVRVSAPIGRSGEAKALAMAKFFLSASIAEIDKLTAL